MQKFDQTFILVTYVQYNITHGEDTQMLVFCPGGFRCLHATVLYTLATLPKNHCMSFNSII